MSGNTTSLSPNVRVDRVCGNFNFPSRLDPQAEERRRGGVGGAEG